MARSRSHAGQPGLGRRPHGARANIGFRFQPRRYRLGTRRAGSRAIARLRSDEAGRPTIGMGARANGSKPKGKVTVRREVSAGGLIWRRRDGKVEVVLV